MTAHVDDRLSAYLDGELPALDREGVEVHLRTCGACAARLEEMAALDALARELPADAPPGYFDSLPGRVRARMSFPSKRRAVVPVWSWAVAAALLLAVVLPRMVLETRAPALSPPLDRVQAPGPSAPRPAAPQVLEDAPPPPPLAATAPPARFPEGGASGRLARSNEASKDDAERGAGGFAQAPKLRQEAFREAKPDHNAPRDSDLGALAKTEQGARVPEPAGASAAPAAVPPAAAPPPQAAPEESVASQFRAGADELKEQVEVDGAAPAQGLAGASPKAAREEARAKRADKPRPAAPWYQSLLARPTGTAAEARVLREEWRSFAERYPTGAPADEARVRVVEVGLSAWRLSNDPADKTQVRLDAEAYLRRDDAAQGQRVRTLLREIGN
jgi:hypothetical protein